MATKLMLLACFSGRGRGCCCVLSVHLGKHTQWGRFKVNFDCRQASWLVLFPPPITRVYVLIKGDKLWRFVPKWSHLGHPFVPHQTDWVDQEAAWKLFNGLNWPWHATLTMTVTNDDAPIYFERPDALLHRLSPLLSDSIVVILVSCIIMLHRLVP